MISYINFDSEEIWDGYNQIPGRANVAYIARLITYSVGPDQYYVVKNRYGENDVIIDTISLRKLMDEIDAELHPKDIDVLSFSNEEAFVKFIGTESGKKIVLDAKTVSYKIDGGTLALNREQRESYWAKKPIEFMHLHFDTQEQYLSTSVDISKYHFVTHGVSYGNQQHARVVKNSFGPTDYTVNNAQLNKHIESYKHHLANP